MTTKTKIFLAIFLAVLWVWATDAVSKHEGRDKTDDAPVGCVSHVKLLKWYRDANEDYFDNTLPKDTEIVWESLRYKKAMGDTDCNEQGCRIRLDPYVNVAPATAQLTEYHEICHVATRDADLDHGPEFQNCMTMLFKKGALDGLI